MSHDWNFEEPEEDTCDNCGYEHEENTECLEPEDPDDLWDLIMEDIDEL